MFCLICMADKLKSLANERRNISQKICFRAGGKQRRQGLVVTFCSSEYFPNSKNVCIDNKKAYEHFNHYFSGKKKKTY